MDAFERVATKYPPSEHGRCGSCGFCGVLGDDGWREIRSTERSSGLIRPSRADSNPSLQCSEGAADLHGELVRLHVAAGRNPQYVGLSPVEVLSIFREDRGCRAWYPYQRGSTPREHREEMRMFQLEEERRRSQQLLAKSLASIERDSVKIGRATEHTAEILKKTKDFGTRSTIILITLSVLVLAVSILALLVAVGVIARR